MSADTREVEVVSGSDNSTPQVSLTSENREWTIENSTGTVDISYTLTQPQGKQSDVSVEVFHMDGAHYGPIVYAQAYTAQTSGKTMQWNGRKVTGQWADSGTYRVRGTALDTDGIGMSTAEKEIALTVIPNEPLKVVKYVSAGSIASPNQNVKITYRMNKDAQVTVSAYTSSGTFVQYLTENVTVSANQDKTVNFKSNNPGLYTIKLTARLINGQSDTADSALSIAVTNGQPSGTASITSPAESAIVQGRQISSDRIRAASITRHKVSKALSVGKKCHNP